MLFDVWCFGIIKILKKWINDFLLFLNKYDGNLLIECKVKNIEN